MKTAEELLKLIEIEADLAREAGKKYLYDRPCGHPHWREVDRLKALLKFTELGVEYEYDNEGCVKVKQHNGPFLIYALRTGKWRVEGSKKWYMGCKVENFVKKYARKGLDESL